ncbi:MAG TPA: L,D-transpeptidase family protein [Clostridia bacterium]|nr:L,D-transpeptidase family protein [Clostridia bacterium]
MRRFIHLIGILVFSITLLLLMDSNKSQTVQIDYIRWEESCLKEYNESKGLYIFIDLTKRTLYFFENGEQIKKFSVAIGTNENPSPIGIFRVIEKGDWGKGFGGRWMGLNVPWGVYGIHGTTKPSSIGRAASHGCIRMRNRDIVELYKLVKHGTTVEIYGGPFGPFGKGFRELHPGDTGADVMEVQRNLQLKGYYKGHLSGYYSVSTERALNSFQKASKLPISNVIDDKTYERLGIVLQE